MQTHLPKKSPKTIQGPMACMPVIVSVWFIHLCKHSTREKAIKIPRSEVNEPNAEKKKKCKCQVWVVLIYLREHTTILLPPSDGPSICYVHDFLATMNW